ncbi:MAG: tetratricopeptide repeat protein, partial [Paracoccaceae bacterium]|nr:tetratricopeptide repeat protein [Paracoccaceae bacterium]
HSNLGNTLKELGRLDEALASCRQAIALKPDFAEAHNNMGNTLKELGRLDEAVAGYSQAIALKPGFAEAYLNLGIAIKNVSFNSSNRQLYPLLIHLLTTGNFRRPTAMAVSILSLLKHDPLIKDYLLEKNFATSLEEANFIIGILDKFPLLHHLMRLCPLPDLQFEKLFVTLRSLLLKNLDNIEVSPKLIYFLSTLSLHCFTNEYVYIESDEETHLIGELQAKISQTVAQAEQPDAIKILCFASYRPLHQYDWCQKLESLDNLEEVKKRLIEEPLLEKMIAKDIPVLEEISDDVSLKVREQYEENPYPRWVKLGVSIKAKPIAAVCDELKLHLHFENIKNVTAPFILIAGCGTGEHSIGTASRFSNCHVTAVDLSLASLAYAQRKTNELGLGNLEYLQADILHLHQMGREFDIIESVGVLHHMEEPMVGWRVLVDLLKPGGLMRIGLYSELARHDIVEVRKEITALRVGTSEADIRKFRQSLAESHDENHQQLTTPSDFFSLSTMRDLIFHVQEHRFTLQQIKNCLDELGLKFCGFENKVAISNFREFHGEEVDICDLVLWHEFEESHPDTFVAMYQFWCQKL